MSAQNKQRITKMSRREVASHAALSSMWGQGVLPRARTIAALKDYSITGAEAEAIVRELVDPLGRFLSDERIRITQLSRAEIIAQALETVAVAAELERRIEKMDANLHAVAAAKAHETWDELGFTELGLPWLRHLQVLLKGCVDEFRDVPSKVPRRTGPRNRLLAAVVGVIGAADRSMGKARCREVASRLLAEWGIASPESDVMARRAAKRGDIK